jgi:GNAT superfamily N-acetyltransferase
MIRWAESDADLERCVEIFNAVDPAHPMALDDVKAAKGRCLLADGGYAYVADSSLANWQYTMVRVRPEVRRRGEGTALLGVAADEARRNGRAGMVGRVDCDDTGSRAWAVVVGFEETRQDVELLRRLQPGDGEIADGIVPLSEEHLADVYAIEVECVPDVPATVPMVADPFELWRERLERKAVRFVALDEGRVVGYATLEHLHGTPHRLEHGLTAVLRSHRGRGLATKLKSAAIAWAAANGYRELITFTDTENVAMRRVNVKVGYVETLGPIVVERSL